MLPKIPYRGDLYVCKSCGYVFGQITIGPIKKAEFYKSGKKKGKVKGFKEIFIVIEAGGHDAPSKMTLNADYVRLADDIGVDVEDKRAIDLVACPNCGTMHIPTYLGTDALSDIKLSILEKDKDRWFV